MNGLVTYFYPDPIEGRTFEPLIFYFEKIPEVGGFHFVNERLHIRTSALLNNTTAKPAGEIAKQIQSTLEDLYTMFKRCKEYNDPVPAELERYFTGYPERPSDELDIGHRMWDVR